MIQQFIMWLLGYQLKHTRTTGSHGVTTDTWEYSKKIKTGLRTPPLPEMYCNVPMPKCEPPKVPMPNSMRNH